MIKRSLAKKISESAKHFPVVAILGPRQSGKTTLAQMVFKKHIYVSLEDLDLRTAAAKDPRTFLIANKNKFGIIIDEFQHVPELLSYIQTIVDREQIPGYFILTGSQNFLMSQAITQSLAGRISIHTLLPLSISELTSSKLLPKEIESMLYRGSYPAIYAKKIAPEFVYRNYLTTYVERDVRQLTNIGDLNTFQTFITLCAARSGQLVNLTSLGNECNISAATVTRWLSILQASYIIFLLHPYHKNLGKRLTKSPKLFFYDTGLMCNLLKIKEDEIVTSPHKGSLFESFAISEILKWHTNHDLSPRTYFWRDKTGHEVDCIIDLGKKVIPVEMKAGRTPSQHFFADLAYWNSLGKFSPDSGFVIFGGSGRQARSYPNLISWQSLPDIFE